MKVLILSLFFTFTVLAVEECPIDFNKYKTQAPTDCVVCQNDVKVPSDKVEKVMTPLINFIEESNDEGIALRKLKVMQHFLESKQNQNKCSNYKTVSSSFKEVFQKYLLSCEKGPELTDIFNKRKAICEWTLSQYNQKITDGFYSYWMTITPDGKPKLIPGKKIEDLEGPIRNQATWCRQVEKNYKNKMFINCGDVQRWDSDFDLVKKVSESMKRDMNSSPQAPAMSREQMEQQACANIKQLNTITATLYFAKCL